MGSAAEKGNFLERYGRRIAIAGSLGVAVVGVGGVVSSAVHVSEVREELQGVRSDLKMTYSAQETKIDALSRELVVGAELLAGSVVVLSVAAAGAYELHKKNES